MHHPGSFPKSELFYSTGRPLVFDTTCLGPTTGAVDAAHRFTPPPIPDICVYKRCVGATVCGVVCRAPWVLRPCDCNVVNSLIRRHLAPRTPCTMRFDDFVTAYRLAPVESAYWLRDPFVHRHWLSKWPKAKQAVIRKSVIVDPVAPSRVHAFIKREVNVAEPDKARLIQGYSRPSTQELFARVTSAFQKAVCDVFYRYPIFPGITITFCSGLSNHAIADWMRDSLQTRNPPTFYERDCTNWDSRMGIEHHLLMLQLYSFLGPEYLDFVEAGHRVKGVAGRGRNIFYTADGTTKSGHNDTSVRNTLINLAIASTALKQLQLRGDILACGDDLVSVIEGDFDIDQLIALEITAGLAPKARKFHSWKDVTFISSRWWLTTPSTIAFAPQPGRILSKLWSTVKPPRAKDFDAYRNGIALGVGESMGHMPVIGAFLRSHIQGTGVLKCDRKFAMYLAPVDVDPHTVLTDFCSYYETTPSEIRELEELFVLLKGQCGVLNHPLANRIVQRDLAPLADRSPISPMCA